MVKSVRKKNDLGRVEDKKEEDLEWQKLRFGSKLLFLVAMKGTVRT